MRLFTAVDIDSRVRREIDRIGRQLREKTGLRGGPVKWVDPEQIHLTLKFLGEVPDGSVTEICRIAEATAREHPAFDMTISGLGTFGRPPRVLWAGVEPCPELTALQADLEDRFEHAGWSREERAFSAHLTLCRIKSPKAGFQLGEAVESIGAGVPGTVRVRQVIVYESQLTSGGPVYTPAGTYDLQG